MNQDNHYLHRIQRLTVALIVSGSLNIILLGGFSYWILKERPPTPYYSLKPSKNSPEQPLAMDQTNSEVIGTFKSLPYEQLKAKLNNIQLIENGYTQRDIALVTLVAYYHFDLNRALTHQTQPLQKRALLYGNEKITVYPGLADSQYQAIIHFANTEKWPFTSQGLFQVLRRNPLPFDTSLVDAFILSSQYRAVELLFNRSEVAIDKLEILAILRDGDWNMLNSFAEKQNISQDLSPARRQRFLVEYIHKKSKAAAYVLLKTDFEFSVKKLDDNTILQMLELLTTKTPSSQRFAIALLSNPRSDSVWKEASARLYDYVGEALPEGNDPQTILARFAPQTPKWNAAPKKAAPKPIADAKSSKPLPLPKTKPAKKEQIYVVQEGTPTGRSLKNLILM